MPRSLREKHALLIAGPIPDHAAIRADSLGGPSGRRHYVVAVILCVGNPATVRGNLGMECSPSALRKQRLAAALQVSTPDPGFSRSGPRRIENYEAALRTHRRLRIEHHTLRQSSQTPGRF